MALLLTGCPSAGGGSSDSAADVISGTLSNGFVRGEAITAQNSARPPLAAVADRQSNFRLNVEGTSGPFLLRGLMDSQLAYHSIATQPSVVNVTPLTDLTVAMLRGEPPTVFYDTLASGDADLAGITESQVATAELRVRRLLQRQLNMRVPDAIVSFVHTPFTALSGDVMHDFSRAALNAMTAARKTYPDFVGDVADESLRCKTEAIVVKLGDGKDELCPASKASGPDPSDSTITRYQFTNALGDLLRIRIRDGTVISAEYGRNNAVEFDCHVSTCAGISLSTPAGDGSRKLTLSAARLAARQGVSAAVLDGVVQSGNGAVPLICVGTRISTVLPDGSTDLQCVARRFTTPKAARMSYAFLSKSTLPWLLNVIAEQERVVWVSIDDPQLSGSLGAVRYRCKNSDCSGVTVSLPDAQGRRTLTLNSTALSKVNADGSLSLTERATVSAVLETLGPVVVAGTCEDPVRVTFDHSDGAHEDLCLRLPADVFENDNDGDGIAESIDFGVFTTLPRTEVIDTQIEVAQYDPVSGYPQAVQVWRRYVNAGSLGLYLNPIVQYRCAGAACAGVSMIPLGDSYQVQFNGTVLQEIDPDRAIGDRTLTINGRVP